MTDDALKRTLEVGPSSAIKCQLRTKKQVNKKKHKGADVQLMKQDESMAGTVSVRPDHKATWSSDQNISKSFSRLLQ